MKNLWPDEFQPDSQLSPKQFLEEQATLLPKVTNGIVGAEVAPISERTLDRVFNQKPPFGFEFSVIAQFVNNYKFTILRVAHGIPVYPVQTIVDESIARELEMEIGYLGGMAIVQSPQDFESLLEKILKSSRMHSIISAILSLSR